MPMVRFIPVDWTRVEVGCLSLIFNIGNRMVDRLNTCSRGKCVNHSRCNQFIKEWNKATDEYNLIKIIKKVENKPIIKIMNKKNMINPIKKELMNLGLENKKRMNSLHKYINYVNSNSLTDKQAKELLDTINRDSLIKINIDVNSTITPQYVIDRIKKKIIELGGEEKIQTLRL